MIATPSGDTVYSVLQVDTQNNRIKMLVSLPDDTVPSVATAWDRGADITTRSLEFIRNGSIERVLPDDHSLYPLKYITCPKNKDYNATGFAPSAPLLADTSTNRLYGTCQGGGPGGGGTVYALNTVTNRLTVLHAFLKSKSRKTDVPAYPTSGPLALLGNRLYGITNNGGQHYAGVIYSLRKDGTGFKVNYSLASKQRLPIGLYASKSRLYGLYLTAHHYEPVLFSYSPSSEGIRTVGNLIHFGMDSMGQPTPRFLPVAPQTLVMLAGTLRKGHLLLQVDTSTGKQTVLHDFRPRWLTDVVRDSGSYYVSGYNPFKQRGFVYRVTANTCTKLATVLYIHHTVRLIPVK
jgi:uncharacterized repeat protein (TIGR03803 family)